MKRHLLLGCASGLSPDRIRNWAASSRRCGYRGDVALLALDGGRDHVELCGRHDVRLVPRSLAEPFRIHDERYLQAWEYLRTLAADEYDLLLWSDVADVVFQADPFPWLGRTLEETGCAMAVGSELVRYRDEPWNAENLKSLFPSFVDRLREREVFCSGIVGGRFGTLRDFLFLIGAVSRGARGHDIVDQAAMNVLLDLAPYQDTVYRARHRDAWVCHAAVSGPTEFFTAWGYDNALIEPPPVCDAEAGLIRNHAGVPFAIVHQYNRIPAWNAMFQAKFACAVSAAREEPAPPPPDRPSSTLAVFCTMPRFGSYVKSWRALRRSCEGRFETHVHYDYTGDRDEAGADFSRAGLENRVRGLVDGAPVTFYTLDDLRKAGFDYEVPKNHWWGEWGPNLNYFFAYPRMLFLAAARPDHDYYWFLDDDVSCERGTFADLFAACAAEEADFLAAFVFTVPENGGADGLPRVGPPMASYAAPNHHWLTHFPGAGDRLPPDARVPYGSYFPIVRLSRRAITELSSLARLGYRGYGEGFVPTCLAALGLRVASLYREDDTSRYFDSDRLVLLHKGRRFSWKEI